MSSWDKKCINCFEWKDKDEYYKHKQMGDGRLGKCKECTKAGARQNRAKNIEHYRNYDRERGNRQPSGYLKEYREKFPNKYNAHGIVGRAIRSGKLHKEVCESCCKKETHAHHDDYLKPLNVRWLCAAHHRRWHVKHGEALNP